MATEGEGSKPADKFLDEIRIRHIPAALKTDLCNIAANNGQTLSGFLKPHLRQIRDSYPTKERTIQD